MVFLTLAEIYNGIEKSAIKKKERQAKIERICSQVEIFPFDEPAASNYGFVRAQLEKKRCPNKRKGYANCLNRVSE